MSEKTKPMEEGTITLKLDNVSTFMTQIGERAQSPLQRVAGIGWHVLAFPFVHDEIIYLSCFLDGVNGSKFSASVNATFRIIKKNEGGFGNKRRFREDLLCEDALGIRRGWRLFVTSEKLLSAANGFVVEDSVEIRVDFSVADVCGAAFNVFETDGALAADVKLKVGDSVFYANKGYLSVVSSTFRDMFACTETAKAEREVEEIELTDLEAGDFKEFLGVIYPTRYPITDANVISLFRIADRFDAKGVIADCERHLMGDDNVPWFDKLKLAVDLNRGSLRAHLLSKMTWDDLVAINQNNHLDELGVDVLRSLFLQAMAIGRP